MKKIKVLLTGKLTMAVLVMLAALCVAGNLASAESGAAASTGPKKMILTVDRIKGDVETRAKDTEEWTPAKGKTQISEGDTLRTKADGEAVLQWPSGHVVKIYSLSELTATKIMFDKDGGKEDTFLSMKSGRMLAMVRKLGDKDSSFEVRTPAGSAAVRGTQFYIEAAEDKETFIVLEGQIEVAAQGEKVLLDANNQTFIQPGKPPAEPVPSPKEILEKLGKDVVEITSAAGGSSTDKASAQPDNNKTEETDQSKIIEDTINTTIDQQMQQDAMDGATEPNQEPFEP
jgi:hypothetical protein